MLCNITNTSGKTGESPRRKATGPVKWQPVARSSTDYAFLWAQVVFFLLGAFGNMGIENITKERKCLYANKENAAGQRAFGVGNAVCHDACECICGGCR